MQFVSISRRRTDAFPDEEFAKYADAETHRVKELFAEGIVRSIWTRQDIPGAVMLLECADEAAARAALDSLPLARRGMLEVQLVPLKAYRGFCP